MNRFYFNVLALFLTLNCISNVYSQPITYDWASGMGGRTNSEGIIDIERDAQGNTYITGDFEGTRSFGAFTLTATGFSEVYIAKYDPNGTCLWAIKGGANFSSAYAGGIAMSSNFIYATGYFTNNINFGTGNIMTQGLNDIYLVKLDPANGSVQWVNTYGGAYINEAYNIVDNTVGGVLLTGKFSETTTFGSVVLNSGNFTNIDLFMANINNDGSCAWAVKAGNATEEDKAFDVLRIPGAGIFLTGFFQGPATFGALTVQGILSQDFFLAKYDGAGNIIWVRTGGSDGGDWGTGLSYDSNNDVYVSGFIGDTADFGSFTIPDNGYGNLFIAKYTNGSGSVEWVHSAGSIANDQALDIVTDAGGSSYVTGYVGGPSNFSGTILTGVVLKDAFIAKYAYDGTVRWVTRIGGSAFDTGKSIALDQQGKFVTAGDYFGTISIGGTNLGSVSGNYGQYLTKMGGGTVGLDENTDELKLTLYPNPSNSQLNIALPHLDDARVAIDIYDVSGKLMKSEYHDIHLFESNVILNVSDLPSGKYIIHMDTSKGIYYNTVVISR